MRSIEKYKGVIPAFYACYNDVGDVDDARTEAQARWLVDKGVKGLYLCGSTGECIFQTLEERQRIAEVVQRAVGDKVTIIVHVGGVGTRHAAQLAAHAQGIGADAIASIPPVYFRLPSYSVAAYWNDISAAAPDTDFFIYNIPQLAGTGLDEALLTEMLKNPRLAGVKNSSPSVHDIELFKRLGGEDFVVLNGPDEQYAAGRLMGADGGVGSTYAVMPELFMAIDRALEAGDITAARHIQGRVNRVIELLFGCHGNIYAALKGVLRLQGLETGHARPPFTGLEGADHERVAEAHRMIEAAKAELCA